MANHVLGLSLRDVQQILATRGVMVTYESIGSGAQTSAAPSPGGCSADGPSEYMRHLDEVFIRFPRVPQYLWRAVDQHGVALDWCSSDETLQLPSGSSRSCCKGCDTSRDASLPGLRSYGTVHRAVLRDARHRTSRYLNNRA